MPVLSAPGAPSGEELKSGRTTFKCEICEREFASDEELSFHKEIEHVRHLPVSGVS